MRILRVLLAAAVLGACGGVDTHPLAAAYCADLAADLDGKIQGTLSAVVDSQNVNCEWPLTDESRGAVTMLYDPEAACPVYKSTLAARFARLGERHVSVTTLSHNIFRDDGDGWSHSSGECE